MNFTRSSQQEPLPIEPTSAVNGNQFDVFVQVVPEQTPAVVFPSVQTPPDTTAPELTYIAPGETQTPIQTPTDFFVPPEQTSVPIQPPTETYLAPEQTQTPQPPTELYETPSESQTPLEPPAQDYLPPLPDPRPIAVGGDQTVAIGGSGGGGEIHSRTLKYHY